MLAWGKGNACLPTPTHRWELPAQLLLSPTLFLLTSLSAAPHPAQPPHLHPLAIGQDCGPLCLCLWKSGGGGFMWPLPGLQLLSLQSAS